MTFGVTTNNSLKSVTDVQNELTIAANMDIKVLQKSNTFSSLSSGGQKIGSWFDRRARKISMKCSKSISVLGKTISHEFEIPMNL